VKSDCAATDYCRVTGCAATGGVCTRRPAGDSLTYDPVCGCDNITYWNEPMAAARGVNTAARGACPQPGAVDCKKTLACPSGARCSYDQVAMVSCTLEPTGTCWVVPTGCPAFANTQHVRRCSGDQCASLCQMVDTETVFYSQVAGCP
jgi:hypothetical protein